MIVKMRHHLLAIPILFLQTPAAVAAATVTDAWINELHYDNAGRDTGEAVELALVVDENLAATAATASVTLSLYNRSPRRSLRTGNTSNGGTVYDTRTVEAATTTSGVQLHVVTFPTNGLQNGPADGLCITNNNNADGEILQFLSYEGTLTATDGPCAGRTSVDIGVSESRTTTTGTSLQLTGGMGCTAADFTWTAGTPTSWGTPNVGQTFTCVASPLLAWINEVHYDNTGVDTMEGVEVALVNVPATTPSSLALYLYTGNGGTVYNSITWTEENAVAAAAATPGVQLWSVALPSNGLQNGPADGLCLVNSDTQSIYQFVSYEGTVTATEGPCMGETSVDLPVTQSSSTPVGTSLQLMGTGCAPADFTWTAGRPATWGRPNEGQTFVCGGSGEEESPATPDTGDDPPRPVDDETVSPPAQAAAWINEIHYDNAGVDTMEGVEVALVNLALSTQSLALYLYTGNGGTVYNSISLAEEENVAAAGAATPQVQLWSVALPSNGLQNGPADGLCLVNTDTQGIYQFVSYEGTVTATEGPCMGETSEDLGIVESSSTPAGTSLQLTGSGCGPTDFTWTAGRAATWGAPNEGQIFSCAGGTSSDEDVEPPPPPAIPETDEEEQNPPVLPPPDDETIPTVSIHDIQGSGSASPWVGRLVSITGLVTGDFQANDADDTRDWQGFFVQHDAADYDDNPQTSEGIFVQDGSSPRLNVEQGDLVTVTGTVREVSGMTQLINLQAVTIHSSDNPLPSPIVVDLETTSALRVGGNYMANLEQYEGMLVSFTAPLVIINQRNLERRGEIQVAATRQFQFTQRNTPSATRLPAYEEQWGAQTVLYDDGRTTQFPSPFFLDGFTTNDQAYTTSNAPRLGDTVQLSGVVMYAFGAYRILSVRDGTVTVQRNPRPAPVDVLAPSGGLTGQDAVVVASLNVLNFFTTLGNRGANNEAELTRQRRKLVTQLVAANADIYGLVELENEFGGDRNGDGRYAIDVLVNDLNAATGDTYAHVDPGVTRIGRDAIAVGFIYKTTTVTLVGTPAILDSTVDPTFLDRRNRPVLAQSFVVGNSPCMTLAAAHLRSKGGSCSSAGDPNLNDGAGNCNGVRTTAATAVASWMGSDPTGQGCPYSGVMGDFNAYARETPILAMEDGGFNNVALTLPKDDEYSFAFNGKLGTLDYIFVNDNLNAKINLVDIWHINEDEADFLDYNLDSGRDASVFDGQNPARASDHSAIRVGLFLDA